MELTAAGRKKIEAAFRAEMDLENEMVSGLNEDERAELAAQYAEQLAAAKGGSIITISSAFVPMYAA